MTDYSKYPDDWHTRIRPDILERAGNCCERCGLPNRAKISRNKWNKSKYIMWDEDGSVGRTSDGRRIIISHEFDFEADSWLPTITIVLTIAHIHDPNPMNCNYDNLEALCQRCHNVLDATMRARNAARTRREKYEKDTGQIPMWGEDEIG